MKKQQMLYVFVFVIFILLFTSCSQKRIMVIMAKTPDLTYDKSQLKDLNKYQKDAVYLVETIKQAYPRLEEKLPGDRLEEEKNILLNDLSRINNDQDFEIRLQAFVALLKDGHSGLPLDYSTPGGGYPIRIFREKDYWVIANIDRTIDSTLIGSRIVSVNQIPMQEIEDRASTQEKGENRYWVNLQFAGNVWFPAYWRALGVTKANEDKLDLVVFKDGVERSFTLRPMEKPTSHLLAIKEGHSPFTRQQNNGFYYTADREGNYAYLQMNTCLDYVSVKNDISGYTNFFSRPFALSYLKKEKKDAMNFGVILQSLFKEIQEKEIDNLIVDLRNNTGGDERTGKQLIWYLSDNNNISGFTTYVQVSDLFRQSVKHDYKKYNTLYREKHGTTIPYGEVNLNREILEQNYFDDITQNSAYLLDSSIPKFKGKVYVLIGNMTFSAAMFLATTMADNGLGIFVGQPIGNKPSTQTGYSQFKLPNTKKLVNLSYMYMERPDKSKNSENTLYPDIELYPTFQDVLEGKDVCFDYVLDEIKKSD